MYLAVLYSSLLCSLKTWTEMEESPDESAVIVAGSAGNNNSNSNSNVFAWKLSLFLACLALLTYWGRSAMSPALIAKGEEEERALWTAPSFGNLDQGYLYNTSANTKRQKKTNNGVDQVLVVTLSYLWLPCHAT